MPTTEHTINDALAAVLRTTRRSWGGKSTVQSENVGMLQNSTGRPDILVAEPSVSPVTVETEVLPAVTVEQEALARLGCRLKVSGQTILSSIAVRLPKRLRDYQGNALSTQLLAAEDLEMALYTGTASGYARRQPEAGWMRGSVRDLSVLIQAASVPPDIIEVAVNHLVEGVSHAAAIMQEIEYSHPGAIDKMCQQLRQSRGEQTLRMAATILCNALVFQEHLANGPGELASVKSLNQLRIEHGRLSRASLLDEWSAILKVNYWPIFDIARRLLGLVPLDSSRTLIERLSKTAEELVESRLMRSHDLTGAVFQRLIADRKFLAAYYTTPASAALLIGLGVTEKHPLPGSQWGDPEHVKALRIADFSCGTGTLLSTAYQRIGQLHELHGGDSEAIHPEMMARSLVGCDVLPAAAHLTASMLAGSHPRTKYKGSSILTLAYGVLPNGTVATGSLELLDPQKAIDIVAITAMAAGGEGETEENTWEALPHQDFDLIVMNPPFVRATGQEADKKGVPNPMFAAFSASSEDQALMGKALDKLSKKSTAHGNAGLASYFFVLADRKLKVDGSIALVMPLSLVSGEAWEETRRLLARKYVNLILISIAGAKGDDMAFSADTGMGECLVIGRKRKTEEAEVGQEIARSSDRAIFVVLEGRPTSKLLGFSVAAQILRVAQSDQLRRLEDGPVGGTRLSFGEQSIGQAISSPLPQHGPWNPTRVVDLSLAQTAYQLSARGLLWLPSTPRSSAQAIALAQVADLGTIGPYHADVDGVTQTGAIRGPFRHISVSDTSASTYPILWSHAAERERCMCFEADCEGEVRPGASGEKVEAVWRSRSHCHFNQNFQFNSQSTSMQYTESRSIGGRAWLSVNMENADLEKAVVAWGNTSLGLLLHWYHANKQQAGRGNVVPTALAGMPVLDVRQLGGSQLNIAVKIFDEFCRRDMLTIDNIDSDPVRSELDFMFLTGVCGLSAELFDKDGPMTLLRKKLAQEPSITGRSKGTEKRSKAAISSPPVQDAD